ncbi:MAG TPA: mannonate dehydratase [Candidatus Dormibacteraeota bacterium]|jgi:mannonate dehydratase
MIQIAEIFQPSPEPWWDWIRQAGVTRAVSLLQAGEQNVRWLRAVPGSRVDQPLGRVTAPPRGARCWERPALQQVQATYRDAGFDLVALEDTPPMDLVRTARAGRDEQIEWFCDMVRAMGDLEIPVLCYNWLVIATWARTDVQVPARGGALTTGFVEEVARGLPALVDEDEVRHDQLWEGLEYFLRAVVPVAEEAGVKLAMHPDDPPLQRVRGVPRIMGSVQAFQRLIDLVPSPANGVTLCQGNFALMTEDLPDAIRTLGPHIHFVHFRDVRGTAENFVETFHDDGQTDLLACMEAYRDIGFEGVLRPDHVPTLSSESNDRPGYAVLGRLHALGYINGLREATYRVPPAT